MSSFDAALAALKSVIESRLTAALASFPVGWTGVPTVEVIDPAPDMQPANGLVIIPPGTASYEMIAFGPLYEARHRVAVQVYAQHADPVKSNAARDVMVKEIAAITTANPSLGGVVGDTNAITNDRDNLGTTGSELLAASIVTLEMIYDTSTPAF